MPKKLKEWPADDVFARAPRGRVYDYDKLFDGEVWELVRGEDFRPKAQNVRLALKGAAKRMNKHLDIRSYTREDGTQVIVLQARDYTPAERREMEKVAA